MDMIVIKDINNYEQNHPELIISDLGMEIDPEKLRGILKYRGINKWLRVRRLLIKLKHRWKDEIIELQSEKALAKELGIWDRYYMIKGMLEMLIDCRQQTRALCHSPRDIDFPHDKHDFGVSCELPQSFPSRPHKRWFWRQ